MASAVAVAVPPPEEKASAMVCATAAWPLPEAAAEARACDTHMCAGLGR